MKKLTFAFILLLVLLAAGGIGFFLIDIFLLPKLVDSPYFGKFPVIQKAAEKTTIINKTEQIVVREDDSVEKVASQSATATVRILSVADASTQGTASSARINTQIPDSKQVLRGVGVLVTNDGFIVTYRNAIYEKDAKYTVILFNGTDYSATLVGVDTFTNLAYLKIDAQNVPAIAFANSDDMRSGKKLIALSDADEDYKSRFSSALLSNVNKVFNLSGKTVSSSEKLEGVFDVDFVNQEKYVGGPVINFNGEMAGVIGSIDIDNKRQYFAIPANIVKSSLEMAIQHQLEERAVLGLYYRPITKEMNLAYGLDHESGAQVFSPSGKSSLAVIDGSPAQKAGFQVGDIIVSVNDRDINLSNSLSSVIHSLKKGDMAHIVFFRNKEKKEVDVQL